MLIDSDGEKKGVVPLSEALNIAKDRSLDLVQVSSENSDPIVCKILDYGKHIFAKKRIHLHQNQKQRRLELKKLSLDHQQIQATIKLN